MTLDFKKIPMITIDGNSTDMDISKELAQVIYSDTKEIKDLDLALDLYKNGEVEINDEQLKTIKTYIAKYFKAFVQKSFETYLTENGIN